MGHCILNGKDTQLLESTADLQHHHFAYMEKFTGNARCKLKEAQDELEKLVSPPSEGLKALDCPMNCVQQTADLLKEQVLPTHLYIATRLEIGGNHYLKMCLNPGPKRLGHPVM